MQSQEFANMQVALGENSMRKKPSALMQIHRILIFCEGEYVSFFILCLPL